MSEPVPISWPGILESDSNLPTLPGVAVQIINLANDPDANVENAVSLFYKDPAITSKLLRAVNSPLYAKPRQVESLQQAVVIMGLNSSLSLALTFNLVQTIKQQAKGGMNYDLYWRKCLLSGIAARAVGTHKGLVELEELFLASLLQDIGMLVLDRYEPEFYSAVKDIQADHSELVNFEREQTSQDHAHLGGLLLQKWDFPQRTAICVQYSHHPEACEIAEYKDFVGSVAVASLIADLFLGPDKYRHYQDLVSMAHSVLGIGESEVQEIIEQVVEAIPSTEALFSTSLVSESQAGEIIQKARELMDVKLQQTEENKFTAA